MVRQKPPNGNGERGGEGHSLVGLRQGVPSIATPAQRPAAHGRLAGRPAGGRAGGRVPARGTFFLLRRWRRGGGSSSVAVGQRPIPSPPSNAFAPKIDHPSAQLPFCHCCAPANSHHPACIVRTSQRASYPNPSRARLSLAAIWIQHSGYSCARSSKYPTTANSSCHLARSPREPLSASE